MHHCSVCKKLDIVVGCIEDYKRLSHYHYRDSRLGPFTNIFAMKSRTRLPGLFSDEPVGVIVYSMPTTGVQLRNVATNGFFAGFDRKTQLALINRNIRCISRVIIEPRFRGLGLATRLVRETMPQVNMPIIEALAVMGVVNPFFEKAGMKAYAAPLPARCVELIEAFSLAGIQENQLVDAQGVQQKLDSLHWPWADFIDGRIKRFLQSYGKRHNMSVGIERTRFVLGKLTARPVYYIWFNDRLLPEGIPRMSNMSD
jgi:hypothetical protein